MGYTKYNLSKLQDKENAIKQITHNIDYISNKFKNINKSIDTDIKIRDNINEYFFTLLKDLNNLEERTYNFSQNINKAIIEYGEGEHKIENLFNEILDENSSSSCVNMIEMRDNEINISGVSVLSNWFEILYNQYKKVITHLKNFIDGKGININNKNYSKTVYKDKNIYKFNKLYNPSSGTYNNLSLENIERLFITSTEKRLNNYDKDKIRKIQHDICKKGINIDVTGKLDRSTFQASRMIGIDELKGIGFIQEENFKEKGHNFYTYLQNGVSNSIDFDIKSSWNIFKNLLSDKNGNGIFDFIEQYGGPGFISIHEEMATEDTSQVTETYVTIEQLQQIYTNTTVTDEMINDLNRVLSKYGITDIENIQHFIAQTCIETGYGNAIVEKGSDKYLNGKKYGKKYSGVGYIQMTWDYAYAAFASYMILESYPDLKDIGKYRNPKSNNRETIFNEYNKIVSEANDKGYDISAYTDIVDKGRDYVKENYAWESAGYYWSINGLTSANSSTPVDDVTKIVNKWTSSYKDRRAAYETVKKYIN